MAPSSIAVFVRVVGDPGFILPMGLESVLAARLRRGGTAARLANGLLRARWPGTRVLTSFAVLGTLHGMQAIGVAE